MYCRNCGNQFKETDKFCGKCGTAVEAIEAVEAVEAVEDKEELEVEEINYSEVKTAYGVDGEKIKDTAKDVGNKVKDLVDKGVKYYKGLHRNNQIIIGVLVAVLLMFVVSGIYSGGGKVSQSTPQGAAKSFMTAIAKGDVRGIQKLIPPDELLDIREMAGFNQEFIDEQLGEALRTVAIEGETEMGKNWHTKLKYGDAVENYEGNYTVPIELENDVIYIEVFRIDGKYYVDFNSIF